MICCNCSLLKRIQISTYLMGSCNCEGNFDGEAVILFHLEFGLEYHKGKCCWKLLRPQFAEERGFRIMQSSILK